MGWDMEFVCHFYKTAFGNKLDGKIRVKKFLIEFVIQKNCKNTKTLAVQKTPVGWKVKYSARENYL